MSEQVEPAITVVREPDYMSQGHFHEGHKPDIPVDKIWSLPIGTKLFTEEQMQARARIAEQEKTELVEALRLAERRSRQPGEGHNEYFERIADEFYQRYGLLAPGKSEPMEMAGMVSDEDRRKKWEAFLNEPAEARREALAKLH